MNTIKKTLVGRPKSNIRLDDEITNQFENKRIQNGFRLSDLPISIPTYRKAIIHGEISQKSFDKLKKFLQC